MMLRSVAGAVRLMIQMSCRVYAACTLHPKHIMAVYLWQAVTSLIRTFLRGGHLALASMSKQPHRVEKAAHLWLRRIIDLLGWLL